MAEVTLGGLTLPLHVSTYKRVTFHMSHVTGNDVPGLTFLDLSADIICSWGSADAAPPGPGGVVSGCLRQGSVRLEKWGRLSHGPGPFGTVLAPAELTDLSLSTPQKTEAICFLSHVSASQIFLGKFPGVGAPRACHELQAFRKEDSAGTHVGRTCVC